jgi:Predicted kinase
MAASPPVLFMFSGLPGTGKTTLARLLARRVRACYLRIDTIEQGLRDLCGLNVQGEGYRLSYRIAQDNLLLGGHVVADCCNPIALTRQEWTRVAEDSGAECRNIEVVCSDPEEHRRRVEGRASDIPGLALPTWRDVRERKYDPWERNQAVRLDTAGRSVDESFADLLALLKLEALGEDSDAEGLRQP